MKLLLENSADVNAKTKYNRTALMLAARYGHEKIVKILLEKSADVNAMVIPILTPEHMFDLKVVYFDPKELLTGFCLANIKSLLKPSK